MGNGNQASLSESYNAMILKVYEKESPLFNVEDITFPLYTDYFKIVDSKGKRVKLAGGNWAGSHMCRHCVNGLQCRPLKDLANDIRYKFKMNCIRLTFSLQLIYDNNVIPTQYLRGNPELIGKTALQIYDYTVKTLTDVGLMVILNNHTSTSQWCCSNEDGDGLWWSYQFPQYKYFECVEMMAERYKDNQRVIGFDLRNQLRKAHGLEASWGDNNPATDWLRAAKIASEKILYIASHWLIFVGGLNYQIDLTKINDVQLFLSVPNKIIYTGHFYSWSWGVSDWKTVSYDSFKKKMFNTQTFVRSLGVPYFLGQFGSNTKDIPWNYLMQYLKQTDIDWTVWCLDGFQCTRDKDQTFGVFTNDFKSIRHPDLLADMISVGPPALTIIPNQKHK